jgi:hypothetical protein
VPCLSFGLPARLLCDVNVSFSWYGLVLVTSSYSQVAFSELLRSQQRSQLHSQVHSQLDLHSDSGDLLLRVII